MILIVTGSRDWAHKRFVWMVLNTVYVKHGEFTLYHGDCHIKGVPAGADAHAQEWAETNPHVTVERFPVKRQEWDMYGPSAGPRRNRRMVEAAYRAAGTGPIFGHAFQRGASSGTQSTIDLMESFSIPHRVWPHEEAGRFGKR
jgi:hypothetical protein